MKVNIYDIMVILVYVCIICVGVGTWVPPRGASRGAPRDTPVLYVNLNTNEFDLTT